jgi:Flp pilus assembly protein TadB
MTAAILAGCVLGVGLWVAWTGLRPAPEPLGDILQRFDNPRRSRRLTVEEEADRDTRLGHFALAAVPPLAQAVERSGQDLRIVGRTPEQQAARVASFALFTLLAGPWIGVMSNLSGNDVHPAVPGLFVLVGLPIAVVLPFTSLRDEAAKRRRAFAHALSSWCDVVVMNLAAGRGVEQAMETAAAAGDGWAFALIRGALRGGYVRGDTPWDALAELGRDLGMTELDELASTVGLAGEEGAAVRDTVAAKGQTIRQRITSDTEELAASSTERMSLPGVLLVLGFLLFLGYPAITAIFQFGG